MARTLAAPLLLSLALLPPARPAVGQRAAAPRAVPLSAPIADVRYTVTFDEAAARSRLLHVAMQFTPAGKGPVYLSLPAWTPGAYEISYFSRWVTGFGATAEGKPVGWEKSDYDTWRVDVTGSAPVTVRFDYLADSLDNAMAWSAADFVFFNGTNVFLYPEGRGFDWGATVHVETAPGWRVATQMTPAAAPDTYTAASYHDLVDMPFFVGRFDLDSIRVADRWIRLASYPAGGLESSERVRQLDWMRQVAPPEITVFGDAPWTSYTVFEVVDTLSGGASGLEHQSSQVDVVSPYFVGNARMASFLGHELFHSWNVKRLRPAELWPYQYSDEQPTSWLWVSEGITDYYADLSAERGGAIDSAGFFALTAAKIQEVNATRPVALTDASLSTWVHPVDGTALIYYSKGSLAGLMLDILIRDASDNRASLDGVMRQLYEQDYKHGRGFTGADWWSAVSAAAGGRSFAEFAARYIDGRAAYPWDSILPLGGMALVADTTHEPLFGVTMTADSGIVTSVDSSGTAALAGVRLGDQLLAVGGIDITDPDFAGRWRGMFSGKPGAPMAVRVRRVGRTIDLEGPVKLTDRIHLRIESDPAASEKAARVRRGILAGVTQSRP